MEAAALVNFIFSTLTLVMNIGIIFYLLYLLSKKFTRQTISFWENITRLLKKHALLFTFILAAAATIGSLLYSEVLGYIPCKLCWFQRIFMYPQAIFLAIAWKKKEEKILFYSLILSTIGGLIAAYHYLSQRIDFSTQCGTNAVDCTLRYVFHYGYITIPMMAVTAFLGIIIISLLKHEKTVV